GHPGRLHVELEQVRGQRDRYGREPAEPGHEAADGAPAHRGATHGPDRRLDVAAARLERTGRDRRCGSQRAAAVDADLHDEPDDAVDRAVVGLAGACLLERGAGGPDLGAVRAEHVEQSHAGSFLSSAGAVPVSYTVPREQAILWAVMLARCRS